MKRLALALVALVVSCGGPESTSPYNPGLKKDAGKSQPDAGPLDPLEDPGPPETGPNCGDGLCKSEDEEDCKSCPSDCGDCVTCGDGICSLADAEHCETCPADCGPCGTCGDGTCEAGVEGCEDCPNDCGPCPTCGDGTCNTDGGEDCTVCSLDCGECPGCGNLYCDGPETCESCAEDCGACVPCGNGECDAAGGEECSSCPEDCGLCPCGDGTCDPDTEDCNTCTADCGTCAVKAGCIQGIFGVYWGNLHAHTHYSDGQSIPAKAFSHAKKAGLDFMWVTDHRERLSKKEWSLCRSQANTANKPGTYVAGCGYEMSILSTSGDKRGHLNVLFTGSFMDKPVGMEALYQALSGCHPCVGQWNHPPSPGNFLNYKYYAEGKNAMRLMELSGGADWEDKWAAFFTALRNGWRISPSANEDNHARNWGDSARASGVWASALTRTALRQAVRARRTFAAFDDTASIVMKADQVCWMGSILRGLGQTELSVMAQDQQEKDTFKRIELYGPNGTVLETHACNNLNPCFAKFTRDVTEATFFVAKATQTDGQMLVSAPIWYEPL